MQADGYPILCHDLLYAGAQDNHTKGVNARITHLEGNRVFIHQTEIPAGINYREEFLRELGL